MIFITRKKRIIILAFTILFIIIFYLLNTTYQKSYFENTKNLRKTNSVHYETTDDFFSLSPFIYDLIVDGNLNKVIYAKNNFLKKNLPIKTFIFYNSGEINYSIKTKYSESNSEIENVNYTIVNQDNKIIHSSFIDGGDFSLSRAGIYKLNINPLSENVEEIKLVTNLKKIEINYDNYLKNNVKKIYIEMLPGQINKMDKLRNIRKANWKELRKKTIDKRFLPSFDEVFLGTVTNSNKKEGAYADIKISGRNFAHSSRFFELPSLDVNLKNGKLIYGLKKFKLYTMKSKGYGVDFILENFLSDVEKLTFRKDVVDVYLNNKYKGKMLLVEKIDQSFFEHNKVIEGKVLSYNTDDLIANKKGSMYTEQNYYQKFDKDYINSKKKYLHELKFDNLCGDGLFFSFNFNYFGNHGFGNDLRYHLNSRKQCVDLITKDSNYGVNFPKFGLSKNNDNSNFLKAFSNVNILASDWRPNVGTYDSYYVLRNESMNEIHDLFLWNTPPPILNIFSDEGFLDNFAEYLKLWDLLKPIIDERIQNFVKSYNSISKKKLGNLKDYPESTLNQIFNFSEIHNKSKIISDDHKYLTKAIKIISDKYFEFDHNKIRFKNLRDELIKHKLNSSENDLSKNKTYKNIYTFLYRHRNHNQEFLIFAKQNMQAKKKDPNIDDNLVLINENTNLKIFPTRSISFGHEIINKNLKDIALNNIKANEQISLILFKVPVNSEMIYLRPSILGSNDLYFGSNKVIINPTFENNLENLSIKKRIKNKKYDEQVFVQKNLKTLEFKDDIKFIDKPVIIPYGYKLQINRDTTLKFAENACLIFFGSLESKSKLKLTSKSKSGWSGIHFHNNQNIKIDNIEIDNIGYKNEFVDCGSSKYTGGVTFFGSSGSIRNIKIENNYSEDALHILNSKFKINNVEISSTFGDALDIDYSEVEIKKLTTINAGNLGEGGDGLDLSASYVSLINSNLIDSSDKNLSLGENSFIKIKNTTLAGGNYGLAIKDGSEMAFEDLKIINNKIGLGIYSKKIYYPKPLKPNSAMIKFKNNSTNFHYK